MNEWKITLQDRPVQEFRIEDGQTLVIGRGAEADVVIDNTAISRRHASVQLLNGACFVSDLGSTNGTRVNGEAVTTATPINAGDVVMVGKFKLEPLTEVPEKDAVRPRADLEATVFVAPKEDSARPGVSRPPRLTVVQGRCDPAGCSTEHHPSLTVGKGSGCDLRVQGWFLGDPQCRVVQQGQAFQLVHEGGWRGTTLNGTPLRGTAPLNRGDVIGVGAVRLRFE